MWKSIKPSELKSGQKFRDELQDTVTYIAKATESEDDGGTRVYLRTRRKTGPSVLYSPREVVWAEFPNS